MLRRVLGGAVMVFFLVPSLIWAMEGKENIALGKPYKLHQKPNYSLCTDDGDATQLTDGEYAPSPPSFWLSKSTVGWDSINPVSITIDLGDISPICGVSYSTAAGVAGVEWPSTIHISVSDDGKKFYEAGELVSLSSKHDVPPPMGEYHPHIFWTDQLKTHGRFVSFIIFGTGRPYIFVDEIEVYKGKPEFLKIPFTGTAFSDVEAEAYSKTRGTRQILGKKLYKVVNTLREALRQTDIASEIKKEALDELDAIEREAPLTVAESEVRIFPLHPLYERIFHAQAMSWKAMGYPELSVWQSGLWDPLLYIHTPLKQDNIAVNVAIMQNEYRAASFNISNAGDKPILVKMEIRGLPGDTNPSYVTVHQVEWTDDTLDDIPVAAALPEVPRENNTLAVRVIPGLSRQIWLTFHPKDIKPGTYEGQILLDGDNLKLTIPLTLKIFPLRFPDKTTLLLGGWDYTDGYSQKLTPTNRPLVIAHLREHFVNSTWGEGSALPAGEYDAEGRLTSEPSTSQFDEWIKRWPDARSYRVFANVGNQFAGSPINTPLFEKKVGAWVTFWANHLKQKGLKPEQMALLLVDEPGLKGLEDETILAWAKPIRAANTGVKIWEDPVYSDPGKANQEMMTSCDVLCFPSPQFTVENHQFFRDYYITQLNKGIDLEFYSCSGPAHLLCPYAYYRLQAWWCWKYGATGSSFWSFCDSYTPFFLDANSVTPSKQMEAIREGVEDYEYLVMLKDAIAKAEKRGVKSKALDLAKGLLIEGVNSVVNAPGANEFKWMVEKDRSVADQVRVKILEILTDLQR